MSLIPRLENANAFFICVLNNDFDHVIGDECLEYLYHVSRSSSISPPPLGHRVGEQCCVACDDLSPDMELSISSGDRALKHIHFEADFWIAPAPPAHSGFCLCLVHVLVHAIIHVLYGLGLDQEQQQIHLNSPRQSNDAITQKYNLHNLAL